MTAEPPTSPTRSGRELPPESTIAGLRKAAAHCTASALYRDATQTVFGEGPASRNPRFVEDLRKAAAIVT